MVRKRPEAHCRQPRLSGSTGIVGPDAPDAARHRECGEKYKFPRRPATVKRESEPRSPTSGSCPGRADRASAGTALSGFDLRLEESAKLAAAREVGIA